MDADLKAEVNVLKHKLESIAVDLEELKDQAEEDGEDDAESLLCACDSISEAIAFIEEIK